MGWFDLVLIIIFFIHIVNGFFRGLVKQLFDVIGFILIIIASLWGSRFFSESLAEYIKIEDIVPHHELIQALGLDLAIEKAPLLIAGIIAFVVLFLLLSIIFRLLSGGFRWINRIPVIGFFNRIGGLFIGALLGMIFVYIIIVALKLIPMNYVVDLLDQSEIVFIAEKYINPVVDSLKELAINYYLSLPI